MRTKTVELGRFWTDYTWDVNSGLPVVLQETYREKTQPPVNPPYFYGTQEIRYTKTYVYGLGLISVYTDDVEHGTTAQDYYFSDVLGSTVTLARDSAANESSTYTYDAFGELRSQSGTLSTSFLFTRQQFDANARPGPDGGLYYLRARYYDPSAGRFISRDPVLGSALSPGTLNRYAYVLNVPTRYIDPLGLECSAGPWDWDDCAEDIAEEVEDVGEVIIDTIEDAVVDVGELLRGFASLNCLDFGIGAAGVLASILAPQLAPGIALGTQLLRVALIEGEMVAFSLSAAINASQIDDKEGISWDDAVNGAGIVVSGVAAIAIPIGELGGGWNTATIVISAGATMISGYQCLQDGGVL